MLPLLSYGLGLASNRLVEGLNGGMMPVEVPKFYQLRYPAGEAIDDEHVAAGDDTVLRKLDDRITIGTSIYSIGDEFIEFGNYLSFPVLGIAALLVVIKRNDKKNLSL